MARLPAGVQPTPHRIRLQGYRKELELRGGGRLNTDLEPDAAAALLQIMQTRGLNKKSAVSAALLALAQGPA